MDDSSSATSRGGRPARVAGAAPNDAVSRVQFPPRPVTSADAKTSAPVRRAISSTRRWPSLPGAPTSQPNRWMRARGTRTAASRPQASLARSPLSAVIHCLPRANAPGTPWDISDTDATRWPRRVRPRHDPGEHVVGSIPCRRRRGRPSHRDRRRGPAAALSGRRRSTRTAWAPAGATGVGVSLPSPAPIAGDGMARRGSRQCQGGCQAQHGS